MKKLILTTLVAASSLFAIEDGVYKCVATRTCNIKTDVCIKEDFKKPVFFVFKVVDNGRKLDTVDEHFKYVMTYKGFDTFESSKYSAYMPSDDVGNSLFSGSISDGNFQAIMACKKIGNIEK